MSKLIGEIYPDIIGKIFPVVQISCTEVASIHSKYAPETLETVAQWMRTHPQEQILDIAYEVNADDSCHIYIIHRSRQS